MNLPSLPSPERLIDSSDLALQQEELALLDLAAQAWKRAKNEEQQARWLTARAEALRYWIDNRDTFIRLSRTVADGKQAMLRFEEWELRRTA